MINVMFLSTAAALPNLSSSENILIGVGSGFEPFGILSERFRQDLSHVPSLMCMDPHFHTQRNTGIIKNKMF